MSRENVCYSVFLLTDGKIVVCNNKVYAGRNKLDLTKDTIYTHPSSIQCNASSEISSLKSSVSDGKILIANAITGKGVATSSSDTFATMADNISRINVAPKLIKSGVLYNGSVSLTGASYVDLILSAGGSAYVSPSTATLTAGQSIWYTITSGNSSSGGQLRFINSVLEFYMAVNYCTVNYKAYA